ncbi:MAG: helix-turn-helix domain-containing protein, partial [Gemmataceae bacterium]
IVMSSEMGVLDIPEEKIVTKWRLQPGKMLLIDLEEGRIIDDTELKDALSGAKPYQQWLDETQINIADLPPEVRPGGSPPGGLAPARGESDVLVFVRRRLAEGSSNLYAEVVERVEREVLTEVLTHTQGNITRAAQLLGITRPTLRSKLAHLGLAVETRSTVAEHSP